MEDILENRHDVVLSHECFVDFMGVRAYSERSIFLSCEDELANPWSGFLTGSMTPNLVSLFNSSLSSSRTATGIHLLSITAGTASGLSCKLVTL